MNDLLGNVKKGSTLYEGRDDDDVETGLDGAPLPPASDKEMSMKRFFEQVEDIKKDLAEIRSLQKEVLQMHEKSKTIVKTKEMQQHQQAMQDRITQVNTVASKTKAKLEKLDKDNLDAQKDKRQGSGSAGERTRTTITAGLKKKLKDLMGEFSELRTRIQEEYREVVERRMYAVTGEHVPDDEIDRIIENGESENIFQKAILEQGRGRVLDTLAEIRERQAAVKDLEQSLLELHNIFLDMAVLVEAQGEMLDNIEKQVARSVNFVKDGTAALQDAKQLQKQTRKYMCCAIFILLIVALVIVLAVVQPWKYTR
mmetsp:Transcript_23457/g.51498  ORF Transcript_23457/g.51498 Transcript_23457/m.51498 type:complete len:312 (-) Transcript_23457:687-1622(-)|eukprot:CAMPEP_0202894406 /NCGR_PEP_ID=MMETSP1392-20130828/3822_1 /ASSEMBLY_ACC=CAM_ASM_000868 /TAXON_ID=225041 /ORGANISM="Chlamydomonas chlamydogama, Strain SAG 11-48b" /LENGTH=311 /DNA_ID=CAMNT_0049579099 /DNA_START=323 /DNA_END=1258 /DNA_ORIENTATION=-